MTATPTRIAIIGLGKIAHDQHLPALIASEDFDLVATVSADGATLPGVPAFQSLDVLLDSGPPLDAVALCTPPQIRPVLAGEALRHGLHVLLEKPPAATLSQAAQLEVLASAAGSTVFAAWHSRFAARVEPARAWLAGRKVLRAAIRWREDVRVWHPGQDWIWQPGGMGVFDPGINALSIATHIFPEPIFLRDAELELPANRAAPIAARLALWTASNARVTVDFDFRQTGEQTWDIEVESDDGVLLLRKGGAELILPTGTTRGEDREYPALYARFAELIREGKSELDSDPLRLVADAFLRGRWSITDAFYD